MIDIAFLGTGAMMPTAKRWLSSALMRIDSQLILLDCGEGTQIPWRSLGWGFKRLSLICFSHWHADHIAGLPGILHALAVADRTEPLTIIGPKGTRDIVTDLRELAPVLPYRCGLRRSGRRPALAAGKRGGSMSARAITRCRCWSIASRLRAAPHFRSTLRRSEAFPERHGVDWRMGWMSTDGKRASSRVRRAGVCRSGL